MAGNWYSNPVLICRCFVLTVALEVPNPKPRILSNMPRTFVSRNKQTGLPVYLDCNATAPMEPAVVEVLRNHLESELGNAGSRTHEHGVRAKRAVEEAR